MISFPLFNKVDITGYGLFPGVSEGAGLHINFQPGLTLILGANGLGKTTLITILYRLLTGPYDISGLEGGSTLGFTSRKPTRIPYSQITMLASRVVDNARNATASITVQLGAHVLFIERRLHDLSLSKFILDDQETTGGEDAYQGKVAELAGVSSFSDWILMLRYLVFYFEDRRALVWDPSAQRQLLRMLLLQPNRAKKWSDDEREILELDTRMRNLRAVVTREERTLASSDVKVKDGVELRKVLKAMEDEQRNEAELRERLEGEILDIESKRDHSRLRELQAEQEREAKYRKAESVRILAIGAAFPEKSETARYILAHLMANSDCLVCGSHVKGVSESYIARIDNNQCVVCGTSLANASQIEGPDYQKQISIAEEELHKAIISLDEARKARLEVDKQYHETLTSLEKLTVQINDRSRQLDTLIRRLPPQEAEMHKQRSELAIMRGRVEEIKVQIESKRQSFSTFVEEVNRSIVDWKDNIKNVFDQNAQGFLLERCQLSWAPHKEHVGQGGIAIEFPSFEVEMTGTDFPSPVRRSGPEQVSESQREFIDLAFRMALMKVSATAGNGSLVMDAPESSIDAVFAPRAANVLSRYAAPDAANRVILTSNLVDGHLIPALIANATTQEDRAERVVDLVKIAVPTAAVRELKAEYETVMAKLVSGNA
jgi:hypothetical protein